MSDDDRPQGPSGESDDEGKPDLSALRRRQAQGTASDLARMGIDPRSLGLSDHDEPPTTPAADDGAAEGRRSSPSTSLGSSPEEPEDSGASASVVQLRPGVGATTVGQPYLEPVAPRAPSTTPEERPADRAAGQPESTRPVTSAEQLLARTAGRARPPRQTRRLLRAVTRGLVTADAAEAVLSDREVVEAVRHRQSDRRVVAFVSGKGGVGCTTVAVGVGTCFAAMREDRSVVVDVQQGSAPLSALFGPGQGLDLTAAAGLDVDSPVPAAASGLGLVDAVEWDLAATRRDVAGAVERLGADHTFTLLDAGDSAGEAAHSALARADQVVVVTGPGDLGLAALEAALDRVRGVNPSALTGAVHVIVCPGEESYRTAHREIVSRLGTHPTAVVVVPPDGHLSQGHAYEPSHVDTSTREAFVRVAAAVALGVRR